MAEPTRALWRLFAEMNSDRTSERVKSHWAFKRGTGQPKWSARPFGFARVLLDGTYAVDENGKLLPGTDHHEEEARLLVVAARQFLAGDSLSSLARAWQSDGISQPSGKPWSAQRLRVVLGHPRNAGKLSVAGGVIVGDGDWSAIFDRETYGRVRRLLEDRSRRVRSSRKPSYPYLLTGLIKCGRSECGHQLVGSAREGTPFYNCAKSTGSGRHGCGRLKVSTRPVDEYITSWIVETMSAERNRARIIRTGDNTRAASLQADVEKLVAQAMNLRDIAQLQGLDADLSKRMKAVQAQLDERRAALRSADASSVLAQFPAGDDARAAWDALSIDRQRAIASDLIDCVTILPAKTRGRTFDPNRIVVTLSPAVKKALRQ